MYFDRNDAFWRCVMIADGMGIDIAELLANGQIERFELDDLFEVCTACTKRDICRMWMTTRKGHPRGASSVCPNVGALGKMRAITQRNRVTSVP